MKTVYADIADKLQGAQRVLFITGAGISADSGLPTYRGVGGLYNESTTDEGISIEEALSGSCFQVRPEITWKYLAAIQFNCRNVKPNAAHLAIARLEHHRDVVVLTQNIDGLHRRAGSSNVIEIHGTLEERHCTHCLRPADVNDQNIPPRCPQCGGIVRPDVVLFEESLPEQALNRLYGERRKGFDMVFVIGTTAVFPYIAEPVLQAIGTGVPTVEINPAPTRLSPLVDFHVPIGAAEAMPVIAQILT